MPGKYPTQLPFLGAREALELLGWSFFESREANVELYMTCDTCSHADKAFINFYSLSSGKRARVQLDLQPHVNPDTLKSQIRSKMKKQFPNAAISENILSSRADGAQIVLDVSVPISDLSPNSSDYPTLNAGVAAFTICAVKAANDI